ncbi:ATP-binding cassette domain-containing protein [Streptomyces sp. NPDC006235]|uniref:ATP-binding cassette domain-containing protein n=1 Tax=Streptomyces sp. NPDC006235 TaxID=3156736 RepID=UPI0033B6513B
MTTLVLPARDRAQLTCTGLRVARGGRTVLHDVEMKVSPGARWGVVGENGRGKSTLLHVLAGLLTPDEGTVHRVGTRALAEQERPVRGRTHGRRLHRRVPGRRPGRPAGSGRRRSSPRGGTARCRTGPCRRPGGGADAGRLGRRPPGGRGPGRAGRGARPCPSPGRAVGQRYRIRLACLLGAEHDFLLLDEPTNHLDLDGLEYLTARLRAHAGAVVVVSHDRALLADVATTILDLDPTRDGRPGVYGGGYAGYREGREAELVRWEEEYEQQRTEHVSSRPCRRRRTG